MDFRAPGFEQLVTHVFVAGDEYLDSDVVFGVKDSLIREFLLRCPPGRTPDGRAVEQPYFHLHYDFRTQAGRASWDRHVGDHQLTRRGRQSGCAGLAAHFVPRSIAIPDVGRLARVAQRDLADLAVFGERHLGSRSGQSGG